MSGGEDARPAPLERVAVFGATGVAGAGVLRACLADARIAEVVAPVRRPTGVRDERLREVEVGDFGDLSAYAESLRTIDAVFYCLGRAVSQVEGGEPGYRRLTLDYAVEAARRVVEVAPLAVFHFLSGAGTNPRSRMMWARVKGETELALDGLGLAGLVCWRPSMILAPEPPPGLPLSYRLGYPLMRALSFVRSWSVTADDLGLAMLHEAVAGRRGGVLENAEIRDIADRVRRSDLPPPAAPPAGGGAA